MTTVDYYISLNSPWTYLGASRFRDMARRHGAKVNVRPAKFTEVFAETGGLPLPRRSPQRQAYRMMELKRWREQSGIPITLSPKHFPDDETPGTRLVIAATLQGLDALSLSLEIGRALWEREESITDAAALEAAARRAGLEIGVIRSGAPGDTELDRLWQQYTREAIGRGVFGAPSYVLQTGEIFWGQDRLDFLDRTLAKISSIT